MKNIFLYLLLLLSTFGFGQDADEDIVEDVNEPPSRLMFFEPSFSTYIPQGPFADKLDNDVTFGFSAAFLYQLKPEKPVFIGLDLYYGYVDSYSNSWEDILDDGGFADFNGSVISNFIGLNGLYRYYPNFSLWGVEPYFEGAFGFKWMNSYETTAAFRDDVEEFTDTDFVNSDMVLSYAGALGLQYQIGEIVYLNLKSAYHIGNSAEYDRRKRDFDTQAITFPIQAMELTKSAVTLMKFDLGVTIIF